jgi:hypothetical protein
MTCGWGDWLLASCRISSLWEAVLRPLGGSLCTGARPPSTRDTHRPRPVGTRQHATLPGTYLRALRSSSVSSLELVSGVDPGFGARYAVSATRRLTERGVRPPVRSGPHPGP